MALNARIYIESDSLPYTVRRRMPSMLAPYFPEDRDWRNFCDSLDRRLRPYEEIKARWILLGVVFTLLMLGILVGIVLRFVLVDDEDTRMILSACLAGGVFLVFTIYFFLMQALVIKPLQTLGDDLTNFCNETSEHWGTVEFQFEMSARCTVYWDSNFDAWINVISTEPVDGRGA